MKIFLFSFIDSKYPNIIPHFLKYYYDFLKIRNFYIILHSEANDDNRRICFEYFKGYDIIPIIVNKYSSSYKCELVNNYISSLDDNSWLIYPDNDEFFEYPYNDLQKFLNECDKNNITVVRGNFCDRISENNELKQINNKESIWKQFPMEIANGGIGKYFGASQYKICALKAKYKYYNSHWLQNEIDNNGRHNVNSKIKNGSLIEKNIIYYKDILNVHHFRCDYSLYDKLKNRIELNGNYYNIKCCLDYYTKVFNNIIKKDEKLYLIIPYRNILSSILY